MPTQILATGSTAANSADVVVADGESLTVALKGVAAGDTNARVVISVKDDAGAYREIGGISWRNPETVIWAPGTYRFTRLAGGTCGVFSG